MWEIFGAARRRLLSSSRLSGAGGRIATGAALTALAPLTAHAQASDAVLPLAGLSDLGHTEIVTLAFVAALLGFSLLSAILLLRTRARAADAGQRLRGQIQTLQAEVDRSRALLMAEPQVLIAWPAGDDHPQIVGDTTLVMPEGGPQRLLAFGTWLAPEPSVALERAVRTLRESGESFILHLTTSIGRSVEATGRAAGGQAIMRLRELTGLRRELAELSTRHKLVLEETDTLRSFFAALPWPVWSWRKDGTLAYANPAYAKVTGAGDSSDAVARNVELLEAVDREDFSVALHKDKAHHARLPIVVGGARRIFDVSAVAAFAGSAAIAVDVSEAANLRAELLQMAEAHRRMLNQLSSGVCVFDAQQHLAFYNESYRRLFDIDAAFLDSRPDDSTLLNHLRGQRKLPEQPDFRAWKAKLHEAYRAVDARDEAWHLPDGRTLRVITTPNPEGGVTYLFDDVTERLELVRRFDALIRVQRETLDNLAEAVAVFGSNGRARLFNPAFATMWRLSPDALSSNPHIDEVEEWCRPLFDDTRVWLPLRAVVTGIDNRASVQARFERKDGSVLDCTTTPLPDGATMLTFQDATDTVNVERALRERNEALETADKMKVDFVHHVSYELRSPLTTIIGFAHLLDDPGTGPLSGKQSEYVGYITSSTNALLAIIDNILDLATIDAGTMQLELGPVDVRKTIQAAAEGIQDRLATDQIALDVQLSERVKGFTGDSSRVIQILYNLLANAVGFSPQGSTIAVRADQDDHHVTISVADQGPGIPADVKDKVFDWFRSHANGSRHRGAGLGLSLVRSFVELHGGTVRVESAPEQGTTVICTFPVEQSAHRSAAE